MSTMLLGLAMSFGAPALKDPPPNIVGIWVVETQQTTGNARPPAGPLRYGFTADGKWRRYCADKQYGGDNAYRIDTRKSSTAIDLIAGDSDKHREVRLGIVKVEGDTMTLCVNNDTRPTEFVAGPGSHNTLYILKRFKPKE